MVARTPRAQARVTGADAVDEGSLTADSVVAKVHAAYMPGIMRCYKTAGTTLTSVRLSFTVDKAGRTTNASSTSSSKELETCLSSLVNGWRFAIPRDKDGNPMTATFTLGLATDPE